MKTTQVELPRRRQMRPLRDLRGDIWRAICRLFPDSGADEMPVVAVPRATPLHIQRFRVLGELGSGGMGTVYRALDPQLEREVAIKVLANPAAGATQTLSVDDTVDLTARQRSSGIDLLSEARMMARLSHPNVLPVYEVGLAEGALFVVMEHIDGCDLATWLATPRSLDEVLYVLAQAGRGLAAAHSRGIVHRDFKPENVLVGEDGRVRVADFGLSHLVSGDAVEHAHIEVTAGTPGYMAPEILYGGQATVASDVFAFATAVAESLGVSPGTSDEERERRLRENGVPSRLRTAIAAGLLADPTLRCSLDVIVANLDVRRWRWRRWVLAAAAACALAAVVLAIGAPLARDDARCGLAPRTWSVHRRSQLVVHLASVGASVDAIGRLARVIDRKDRDTTSAIEAACRATRAGQLTQEQAQIRQSCLARRRFELASAVELTLTSRPQLEDARLRVLGVADADSCAEITPPPLADPALARALYARYVASRELRFENGEKEVAEIEEAALGANERELAARAALNLAHRYNGRDKLVESEAAAQRAHKIALEIHALELAAAAFVERSRVASLRGDGKSAANFAQLARELIDRPAMSKRAGARVYSALGRAHNDLGEYRLAAEELQRGIALVDEMSEHIADIELPLRITYVHTLATWQHDQHAVEVARETVEQIRELVGDRDPNYAVALNMLAYALRSASDLQRALPIRRHALAVLLATMPADDSHVLLQRADLADDLVTAGEFDLARNDYERVLGAAEHNETLKGSRVKIMPAYALATFHAGRIAKGLELQEKAYEEALAQYGADHPWTLVILWTGIELALEVGNLDTAERKLEMLHAGYRKRPEQAEQEALARGLLDADLALTRKKPRLAEKLVRDALAECVALHSGDAALADLHGALGEALRAQRHYGPAREAIETARELAVKTQARGDVLAWLDIQLAAIDLALGHRAEAFSRASRAREVLDRFPGRLRARAEADALIVKSRRS